MEDITMIIKRDKYMKFLNEFKDNDAIKVITGICRSGKTFLMNMFIDQLKDEGIQDDQIIHINFEDLSFNDPKIRWTYISLCMSMKIKKKELSFL
jgi:predicted AAA+ superfamily ATPase